MVHPDITAMANTDNVAYTIQELLRRLSDMEQRVVEAETRADEAEDKVRVMEQQLSTSNAGSSWTMGEEEKLCTLENAVREKERVISRLECQVEEQRLLRLQESRQVEEKAARIKDWVSNKLRDLEVQNQHLRTQNQKCETQLELLKSKLTQLSTLNGHSNGKKENRNSTEDSSRGSYEGDRLPSDESPPPPDSSEGRIIVTAAASAAVVVSAAARPMSATAACLAAIRRRSGAFDNAEERRLRRGSNLAKNHTAPTQTNGTSTAAGAAAAAAAAPGAPAVERRPPSNNVRSSKVDSGSVDMETPQSLSPRSPLDALEALDASLPPFPPDKMSCSLPCTSSSSSTTTNGGLQGSNSFHHVNGHHHHNHRHRNGSGGPSSNGHGNRVNGDNNNVINISSPPPQPVPSPVPVTVPVAFSISQTASPVTPLESVMIGGAESTQSLILPSDRRVPIVPPRRCRTRSPTPKSSNGTTPGHESPVAEEEDCSMLRARLDAECQQLARDLQAAVQELVRPELPLKARAMDELHDYSEIYTPSCENPENRQIGGAGSQPPPPPIHRFPSWESRLYELAAGGLKVPVKANVKFDVNDSGVHGVSNNPLRNVTVPVYTTVKGRASQIRSAPFSGDSSDSSDGEDMASGSGGSGPSYPLSSAGDTDISSPGKSAATSLANSLSPTTQRRSSSPSKSYRREPSMISEMSSDYAIPPDAYASETNSMDIALAAGCQNLNPGLSSSNVNRADCHSSGFNTLNSYDGSQGSPRKESLEKSGYLTKLGGKLKTWRKRWFVLKNGTLTYWKTSQDVNRRSAGREILLDENCRITKGDGAGTFEIATGKKTYYLTADSVATVEEWVRVLQNVVRRNAAKLVLSMEDPKPTLQGWLTKVKNGHARRCWCILIGKMFLTFRSSSDVANLQASTGQINMKDARVKDVDHKSDSDNEDKDDNSIGDFNDSLTIEILPSHQTPIYLHFSSKQDKDAWLYHLTVVSGKGPSAGTQFEQAIHKLMEVDGDPNNSLWKSHMMLHSKESITSPLTSLSTAELQNEAVKLFKSCQLFMSVPLEPNAIDYHVGLAQNTLQLCLDHPELQGELICALVKQTSRTMTLKSSQHGSRTLHKLKHSRFLNATHSLFVSDSSGSHKSHSTSSSPYSSSSSKTANGSAKKSQIPSPSYTSPSRSLRGGSGRSSPATSSNGKSKGSSSVPSSPLLSQNHSMHHHSLNHETKSSVRSFVFIQGWQLLSLAVSLFLPKNSKLLWYLKQHLQRNVDVKSETGKYAAYCQRSIERTLANGQRLCKPSRMEVLSILTKNPFHHSLPHSVPVHFLTGNYHIVGFDGSMTVEEFLSSLCHQIGCRDPHLSGFALCEDDPFEQDFQLTLRPTDKVCDVISQWETTLREKAGRIETKRAVSLTFVSRIYRRTAILQETERERLLLCYQTNKGIVSGKFPVARDLAMELTALMAQIDTGDHKMTRSTNQQLSQIVEKYYPSRYREDLSQEEYKKLCDSIVAKWIGLRGKGQADYVRTYLNCTRKWPFFGATLFNAKVRGTHVMEDGTTVWAAIYEDGIAILDYTTLMLITKYNYATVQTFGGVMQEDCFMVVIEDMMRKRRILFTGMSKHKVYEMTQLVAEYYNLQHQHSFYTPPPNGDNSLLTRHNSLKSSRFCNSSHTLPPATPKLERKVIKHELNGSARNLQRESPQHHTRSPRL